LKLRIETIHRPYHQALSSCLDDLIAIHGEAILLDCHSMPSRPRGQANFVIGDRHGTSSAPWISAEAARIVRSAGFSAALNDPYAGGAIIKRHGKPIDGVHALQLESDRSLYLDRDARSAGPGFDRIAGLIEALATGLGAALLARSLREAAE
jgi:N-formylglutamate amidohydrolase